MSTDVSQLAAPGNDDRSAIPDTLPAQIGCLGRYLLDLIQPWTTSGHAVAIDSTILRARGGVWHQKHREKGELPHTSIDPVAHWTRIGLACSRLWLETARGFRRGGRLVSIAAVLTPANVADSEPAPALLREVPAEVRFVLGDRHDNTPELHENCDQADRLKVSTKYGRYPHTDDGIEMRRIFHKLRSLAMENFHELIFGIFDGHGQVPDLWPDRYLTLRERRQSWSINWPYSTALSTTWNSVSVSKLSQGGLMMYDQASTNSLDCNLERSRRSQPTCILKPNNKKFPALA